MKTPARAEISQSAEFHRARPCEKMKFTGDPDVIVKKGQAFVLAGSLVQRRKTQKVERINV